MGWLFGTRKACPVWATAPLLCKSDFKLKWVAVWGQLPWPTAWLAKNVRGLVWARGPVMAIWVTPRVLWSLLAPTISLVDAVGSWIKDYFWLIWTLFVPLGWFSLGPWSSYWATPVIACSACPLLWCTAPGHCLLAAFLSYLNCYFYARSLERLTWGKRSYCARIYLLEALLVAKCY